MILNLTFSTNNRAQAWPNMEKVWPSTFFFLLDIVFSSRSTDCLRTPSLFFFSDIILQCINLKKKEYQLSIAEQSQNGKKISLALHQSTWVVWWIGFTYFLPQSQDQFPNRRHRRWLWWSSRQHLLSTFCEGESNKRLKRQTKVCYKRI